MPTALTSPRGTNQSPRCEPDTPDHRTVVDRFRLGDASLNLSGDAALTDRFHLILSDCRETSANSEGDVVSCFVDTAGDRVAVTFTYPGERRDLKRCFQELSAETGEPSVQAHVVSDTVEFNSAAPWRGLVANAAIQLTFAVQPSNLFIHGASVAVRGRGVLLLGPKGSGKSTLALAFGLRSQIVLGDEIAAVRVQSRELLPLRRAASIRQGPQSASLDALLSRVPRIEERFPDGSSRLRARLGDLFPGPVPDSTPLRGILMLRRFGNQAHVEPFSPTVADAMLIQPLGTSLWGSSDGGRRFQLLQLLSQTRCYHLDAGGPDATAEYIENLVEDL